MSQIADLKALLSATQMYTLSIADQRKGYDALADIMPAASNVNREKVVIKGIPCEWYGAAENIKNSSNDAVLIYLHGGGYVIGSLTSHQPLYADLCNHSGLKVLGVDYRLAPEHPHPAAVDDALSVYEYLISEGYKPDNIAIAGDSAGGGLTLALLISIRDKTLPKPAAAVLISPWVDLTMSGNTIESKADNDPVVALQGLQDMADNYCGGSTQTNKNAPLVSPLFADLHELPPILIHVGTDEILLDDSVRLKNKLIEAGVEVEYKEFPEMIHVFHHFAAMLDTGKEALAEIGEFLKSKTN